MLEELTTMHERQLHVQERVLGDVAVCEQIDTLTIYLLALLLQPRLANADAPLKALQLMLDCL